MTLPMMLLAQVANPTIDAGDAPSNWLPVALLVVIGLGFALTNIAASLIIGPSRTGPGKETTYESGMMPVGDTRRRINVRFYIVAMIFLVIDVDIIFFYPWASIFSPVIQHGSQRDGGRLMVEIVLFVALLLVAYLYAWGKGVFRWD